MFSIKITTNPVAKRSQKWISNALLELMKEKPYKKITITEICNKANLVRETFYRNFSSKDAVVKYCLELKFNEFLDSVMIDRNNLDLYDIGIHYFTYWKNEKEFLKILIDNKLINIILDNFSQRLNLIIDQLIRKKESLQARNYIVDMYAGATTILLIKWIQNNCKESPEEMARIITEYGPINSKYHECDI
ncbi:MAG: TetR/AcrR family transcriptional regulator [Tissierellia bacterium]|nr:TetR/AcrR family transcriptional regulator [Tissierellia bacterium]